MEDSVRPGTQRRGKYGIGAEPDDVTHRKRAQNPCHLAVNVGAPPEPFEPRERQRKNDQGGVDEEYPAIELFRFDIPSPDHGENQQERRAEAAYEQILTRRSIRTQA